MPLIKAGGYTGCRDDLNWSLFETAPGVFTESTYKQPFIDDIAAAGLKFVATIAYPPSFYTNTAGTWPLPTDTTHWAEIMADLPQFCAWLAVTEGPKVTAIEIVNEPNNIAAFAPPQQGGSVANLQRLVTLTNACVAAVHAVSPSTQVIGMGEQGTANITMLGLGLAPDGVTYHPYDNGDFVPEVAYEPSYTGYVQWVTALQAVTNIPIWETERNISTGQQESEYTAADWNARRILQSWALNVAHTFIYDFIDFQTPSYQSVYSYYGHPQQTYFVIPRILSALTGLSGAPTKKFTISEESATFDAVDVLSYVYTVANGKTVGAIWFGNHAAGTFGTTGTCTVQFPLQHTHIWAQSEILDTLTGLTTPILEPGVANPSLQPQWTYQLTIANVTVSEDPQLIIVK